VILVDANLLVYAHITEFDQHAQARDWLDDQLNGTAQVGLPWVSLLAFLRLATNPRVLGRPRRTTDAWRQVTAWLDCAVVWVPAAGERHRELLGQMLAVPGINANHVPDAHLAALAMEHGLILCSADHGFARFPGLRWTNPLVA
jgi:uncharacterized protein